MPERRLRAERRAKSGWRKGRWKEGHTPDGLLYVGDKKPIAIELEISLKESNRLRSIVTDYVVDRNLREVWYFLTNDTARRAVERMIRPYSDFRIFSTNL